MENGNENAMTTTADGSRNALIVYILYLVGIVTGGLAGLIGVVFAYVSQGEADDWVASHYRFQIRTFWISFVASIIVAILCMIFIGLFLIPVLLIWFIVRCVIGLNRLTKKQPIGDPTSWLFG